MKKLRLLPDSIVGRMLLLLLVGLLLSHSVALAIYSGNRLDTLISVGGQVAADRVASIVQILQTASETERRRVMRSLDTGGLRVTWTPEPVVEQHSGDDTLAERIRNIVGARTGVDEVRVAIGHPPEGAGLRGGFGPGGGMGRGMGMGGGGPGVPQQREGRGPLLPDRAADGGGERSSPGLTRMVHGVPFNEVVRISVRLDDRSWLNFVAPLDTVESLWGPRFIASLSVMAVCVAVLLVWALRRATKPFATFAKAAERLGVDVGAPPLNEAGPREVRTAAHAFNVMQGRLRRFVEDRTQMLAAISHDLRTPITRMRLRAEFVDDDEQREKMLADLAEMEAMIASTLAFARDDAAQEPRRPLDLGAMLHGLADDYTAAGQPVTVDGPDNLTLEAKPTALKRALSNLIDNALKYGKCADVSLSREAGTVVVEVADRGPGIPAEERERVFAPFFRLERSRSRDTGGSGLGLSVARTAIRGQGGDVTLGDRDGGGLVARLTLPE